jgi:hypothetical protein
VQRRASNTGTVMVVGQKIALGRVHAHKTVTIDVPPPDVEIDMEQLHREHLDRTTWLAQRSAPEPDTNWSAVRAGAAQLL